MELLNLINLRYSVKEHPTLYKSVYKLESSFFNKNDFKRALSISFLLKRHGNNKLT